MKTAAQAEESRKEVSEALEAAIIVLANKGRTAHDSIDALKFTQAALNIANTDTVFANTNLSRLVIMNPQ